MSALQECIDLVEESGREGLARVAHGKLDAMERRLAALEQFAAAFAEVVAADFANEEAQDKGGMQVTLTGDFVRLPPSVKSRLRWWAERAKEALEEGK